MSTCHEQARYEFGAQMYSFRYPKISGLNLLSSLGDVWRPPADPVSTGGGVFESRVPPASCVLNPAAPVSKGGGAVFESRLPSARCVLTQAAPVSKVAGCFWRWWPLLNQNIEFYYRPIGNY